MTGQKTTRALLVYPRFNEISFWSLDEAVEVAGARATCPPLGLLTLAALLPQHWEFRLINCGFQELTAADLAWADIVLTGGMISQHLDIHRIVGVCQAAGVPVAVGGPSPTSEPEAYAAADFIVAGEAEGIVHEFVAAWDRGERRGVFTAPKFQADITKSPIPRYDLIDFRDYAFVGVQFSRGCPFTCEFCDIIELYGRVPRTKTTPQILAELDRLHELGYRGHLDFVDDNLIGNKKAVRAFLPHLIAWQEAHGYPFMLSTEASLNLTDDPDLLGLMRRANFFCLFTGIESPDEETLVHTSKKQNTRRSISESIHKIYGAGMFVTAGFIVGFDTEKGSISRPLTACIEDTAIPMSVIGLLTALPNTQLSRRLHREGRLFDRFNHLRGNASDAALAGLNFTTLRPRREVLIDFRDTVAAVYAPAAFFGRVERLIAALDRPKFATAKVHWPHVLRDARALGRVMWRMSVRYPELRPFAWRTLFGLVRRNPRAVEAVMRNVSAYLHHYRYTRFIVGEIDALIAEIDAGTWTEPAPLPPSGESERKAKALARPPAAPVAEPVAA